jgi:glycosyltransferase involved in cell wall biosynthesis
MNSKLINVVIELGSFDRGGLEKVVLDSALKFNSKKFNVTIVSVGKIGLLAEVAIRNGINVVELSEPDPLNQYKTLLINKKIDLAISHFSRYGYQLFHSLGIKNITYIHNVYAFMSGEMLKNFIEDDRYVGTYISVSPNATRYAVQKLGLSREKVITVPNGLCFEEHEQRSALSNAVNRNDFGLAEDDYAFLNVASYNLHKGHYVMAAAMKIILETRSDIKILCIGNVIVPEHVRLLKEYLDREGLANHILMPGHYPDVEKFFRISDAFLLPSFIEGWSIAMNEAMYYEKPLLLTNTGGASEVISNEDIGILINNEYGDILNLDCEMLDRLAFDTREFKIAKDLAEAMIKMANNKKFWSLAGRAGKKKILDKYSMQAIADRYCSIMENVLRAE